LADAGDLQAIGQLRETLSDAFDRLRVKATQQFHVGDHLRWTGWQPMAGWMAWTWCLSRCRVPSRDSNAIF
jgi:hypothetical protein